MSDMDHANQSERFSVGLAYVPYFNLALQERKQQ